MHFLILSYGLFLQSPGLLAHILTVSCPHQKITFKVELAETPEEQEKGLMFRSYLAPDKGMLFLYDSPQTVSMWMRNTLIPLDMIFSSLEGKILAIHEDTIPLSLKIIGPVHGTTHVLEVMGGTVKAKGITENCTLSLRR